MVIDILSAELVLGVFAIDRITIALTIGGAVFLLGAVLSIRHLQ